MKKTFKQFVCGLTVASFVAMSGCSLLGSSSTFDVCSAVSAAQAQQTAIETAAAIVIGLHNAGKVDDATYTKVETAYNTWAGAQPTLASALVDINDNGNSAPSLQEITTLVEQVAVLAGDVISIIEIIPAVKAPVMSHSSVAEFSHENSNGTSVSVNNIPLATTGTTACTITDATIQQELIVPVWAAIAPEAVTK